MKTNFALLTLPLFALLLLVTQGSIAKDEPLDFLHLLQERGYADLAIDYLKGLKADTNPPKDVQEVMDLWDLEMSRSYKAAAKDAYREADQKEDEKQRKYYLDKFIKENPDRPEAMAAAADVADEEAKNAVLDLARAQAATDPKEKADLTDKARKSLTEVKPRFLLAVDSMKKRLAALLANPKSSKKKREEAQLSIVENQLNAIIVDFYMAMSYPDGSSEHAKLLSKASKSFDDLFQEARETQIWIALNAHYWQGRVLQDLKNYKEALAIYDEVLAGDTDVVDPASTNSRANVARARRKTGMEGFFAEVEFRYLECMKQTSKKLDEYFDEARKWRVSHKLSSEATAGYQALTLDLAKAYVAQGEKYPAKKAAWNAFALKLLAEMLPVASPSRLESIKLRKLLKPGAGDTESFDEFLADANAAVRNKKWAEAAEAFEKALAHAPAKTSKATIDDIRGNIAGCIFTEARELYTGNKVDKASELLTQLLAAPDKGYRDTTIAAAAAKFKLEILFSDYWNAPAGDDNAKNAKKALGEKVMKTAEGIAALWPGKPQADAARLVSMKLLLSENKEGNLKAAFDHLQKMNPKSEEYGTALHLMGASSWHAYIEEKLKIKDLEEKKSLVAAEDKTKRDENRKQAMDSMRRAREVLKSLVAPDARMSKTLVGADFALAQMCFEGNDFKEAAVYYAELIADIDKSEKPTIDDTTLNIFNGAFSTYLQLTDIDKAANVASLLLKLGPDEKPVNRALIAFAGVLEKECKALNSKLDSSQGIEADQIRNKRDSLESFLKDLVKRQQLEPKNLIWIASTAGSLGLDNMAAEMSTKILERCKTDKEFNDAVEKSKAIPLLETLLVDIQARKGNYADAVVHVDELIKRYPNALQPLITKAEILEKWARSIKEPAKYEEAIKQWDLIRSRLQRVKPDPKTGDKMPEFYDAIYREAFLMCEVAKKFSDKQKAVQGLQLIQPVLMFDSKMSDKKRRNYDLYTRYIKLKNDLAELAGIDVSKKSDK